LTLWENDLLVTNPEYHLKIWKIEGHNEYDVKLHFREGGNRFVSNTLSIVDGMEILTDESEEQVVAFPNPTAREVVITFTMSETGPVSITLIDLMGSEQQIFNEHRNTGRHAVTLDLGEIPSGQYIFKVRKEKETTTGKLAVIK
jgi:hypothetical protein